MSGFKPIKDVEPGNFVYLITIWWNNQKKTKWYRNGIIETYPFICFFWFFFNLLDKLQRNGKSVC